MTDERLFECMSPSCWPLSITSLFSSIVASTNVVVSWDMAAQVLVFKEWLHFWATLIGFRFVGCLAYSGMEMHEWPWKGYCCDASRLNMGFGTPRTREVPVLLLNSYMTLDKPSNFLKTYPPKRSNNTLHFLSWGWMANIRKRIVRNNVRCYSSLALCCSSL